MSSSLLTESLRADSETLRAGATDRIHDYERRFQALGGITHQDLSNLRTPVKQPPQGYV